MCLYLYHLVEYQTFTFETRLHLVHSLTSWMIRSLDRYGWMDGWILH